MEKTLKGAVAVITGGGRGIGAATAIELAARGASICIAARTEKALLKVALRLAEDGDMALPVVADVTLEDDVKRLFREVRERLGPVTHLVNNAGALTPGPLRDMTLSGWRETLDANLTSTFLCTREALADMLPKKAGRIVNVASLAGVENLPKLPRLVAYAAAKAGVIAFTEALAAEVGPEGVRVLCVSPGKTGTRMLEQAAPGAKPDLHPHDVARIIAFLAGEHAGAANGANLLLRGVPTT